MSKARIARFLPPLRSKRGGGASRFEIMVVAVLISIVAALLLERLTRFQEYAEKAVMEATIANLRSGLRVRIAEMMIGGRMARLADLQRENPIDWLAAPPPNYGGVLTESGSEKPIPGNWYFDASARQLVYLPYHHRFFRPANAGAAAEVRLQAKSSRIAGGGIHAENAGIEGLSLAVSTPYRWD